MAENWLVFQCANAAEHWRPNGISIVCYLLSLHALLTLLTIPLELLGTFPLLAAVSTVVPGLDWMSSAVVS